MKKRLTPRRMAALFSALFLTLVMAVPVAAGGNGAIQVSGIGYPDDPDEPVCTELPFDYTIVMTGDLEGCVYGVATSFKFGPSGVAKERADEIFVGSYDGHVGTFGMTENWHAKFDASGTQVFGFCKHPIVRGSGTDGFEGVRGRLDFRDDLDGPDAPRFVYKGHLKNLD